MTEMPAYQTSKRQILIILWVTYSLFPLIGMGIDLLSPALPSISDALHVPHSDAKQIVSIYLLGYLCGTVVIGLSADCFNRRRLFITCVSLFTFASICSIFTTTMTLLLLWRFLQGLSFGVAGITARAISCDILPTQRLMRLMPLNAALWGLGPIIGPMIGGYLEYYFRWQACYMFFAIYAGLVLLGAIFYLPQTQQTSIPFQWQHIKNNILTILRSKHFIGVGIVMGLVYSILIAFNVLAPFLIQDIFGKSSIYYGHVALSMGAIYVAGTFVCRAILKRFSPEQTIQLGLLISIVACLFSLLLSQLWSMQIMILLITTWIILIGCALVYPSGMARCAASFRHIAATSAAMMMSLSMCLTTSSSMLLSFIPIHTVTGMLVVYFVILLIGLVVKFLFVR